MGGRWGGRAGVVIPEWNRDIDGNSELDSNMKTTTSISTTNVGAGDPEVQGGGVHQTTPTVIETTYPNRKSAETLKDCCRQQTNGWGCGCVVLFNSFVVFPLNAGRQPTILT